MDVDYRGPDRRPLPPALGGAPLRAAAGRGALAGAGAALVVEVATGDEAPAALALVVGSAPLVVTTVLLLCAWRLGGRARQARAALALALAVVTGPLVAWTAAGAAPAAGAGPVAGVALAAGVLAALPHARAARWGPEVDTRLRPGTALLASSGLVLTSGAGAAVLAGAGWTPPGLPPEVLVSPAWALLWPAPLGAAGGAALALALGCLRASLRAQRVRALRLLGAVDGTRRGGTAAEEDAVRRHDARSALAAVRAATAVLTGEQPADLDPASRRSLAAAVHEELGRVERLLAEPGHPVPVATGQRPGVVDLREAVGPLVTTWRARGLEVTGPPPGPPVLAVGNADAVRRAVANLLDNALRHAPGAAVTVSTAASEDGGPALLVVHDDGPGVSAAHREAVFTAGTRLAPSAPGHGLGLASARALAEADGGSLRLAGAARGARFELRLPAARPPAAVRVPAPAPIPDLEEVTAP